MIVTIYDYRIIRRVVQEMQFSDNLERSHITNMMILEFTVCNTASAWIHDEESFEISPIVTPGAPLEVP